jgi:membrane-associated protease RseP (regulator of RpoE activity)
MGGEIMIGAVVFVISFIIFLLISLVTPLLPGAWIIEQYIPDLTQTSYAALAEGIINGVIYGLIIWVIFSIAKMLYDRMRGPKEVVVKVEAKEGQ